MPPSGDGQRIYRKSNPVLGLRNRNVHASGWNGLTHTPFKAAKLKQGDQQKLPYLATSLAAWLCLKSNLFGSYPLCHSLWARPSQGQLRPLPSGQLLSLRGEAQRRSALDARRLKDPVSDVGL